MKKLTIFSISLVACFFIGIAIDLACGPEPDPYDYYASFFHNTIQDNQGYKPFYFNGLLYLNDDNNPADEGDINSKEWALYLGKGVLTKDVRLAMYDLPHKADSALLLNYLKSGGRLPDSLRKNTFLRAMVSGRHNNALQYYRFAKSSEPLVNQFYGDRWNPKQPDPGLLIDKEKQALQKAAAEKDSFIKLRYYYQAQRFMRYAGKPADANAIYDKYIANVKSKSHVMGWALSLRAGGEKDHAKSAFLFSKVFANYPERRIQAFHDFNNINEKPQNILKYAKTGEEKAFVYAIKGFHVPRVSLSALENIYRCQPKSPLIKVLLVREINKIEESYLSAKRNKTAVQDPYSYLQPYIGEDSTVKKQRAYIPKLKVFCRRLTTTQPVLANLSLAYLSWIQEDNTGGFKALAAIDSIRLGMHLDDQKQMIKLLLLSQKITKLDTVNEQELVPLLTWLNKKVQYEARTIKIRDDYWWAGYGERKYSASCRDFYSMVLAPVYLRQKDTAMAALVMLKSKLTITPADPQYRQMALGFNLPDFLQRKMHSYVVLKLIGLSKSGSKTAYLKLLTSDIDRDVTYNLYDLLGTTYLREHRYNAAVRAFKNIPEKKLKRVPHDWNAEMYSNPFLDRLHDYPKKYDSVAARGYTKLQFAKRMARLQSLIQTDPKNAARYYYTLATGLYSTSFYSNAWYYISYSNSSYDRDRMPTEYYDADFLTTNNAEKYFLKARALPGTNNEFKAKCTFMAAKCRQKRISLDFDDSNGYNHARRKLAREKYAKEITRNPYFTDLQKKYNGTAFYKVAVNECSYFRDFIGGKKK
ncbi:hypothetical protein [Mucilaginibacter dorajii]|uniref:hypothetical protein n=1 Tax=Mucilaginibacter dorajii TaxID=692994 RepID=UPI0031CE9FC4